MRAWRYSSLLGLFSGSSEVSFEFCTKYELSSNPVVLLLGMNLHPEGVCPALPGVFFLPDIGGVLFLEWAREQCLPGVLVVLPAVCLGVLVGVLIFLRVLALPYALELLAWLI